MNLDWLKSIPDLVIGSEYLKDDGFFILEHPRMMDFRNHESLL